MAAFTLSLHAANRVLERSVPLEAVQGVQIALPLLCERPLKFKYKGVVIVATLTNGRPKIITCWRERGGGELNAS